MGDPFGVWPQLKPAMASNKEGGTAVHVAGVRIDIISRRELLQEIAAAVAARQLLRVYFVNPHTVNLACSRPAFMAILNRAERTMADGIGVVWVARWLGGVKVEQISTDKLAPGLFAQSSDCGHRVFLLGAAPAVCERAAATLPRQFTGLQVVGHYAPEFCDIEQMDNDEVIRCIRSARPDILLVALGNLKQEPWIDRFADRLGVPVILTAGGYLDYVAGQVKYAPRWIHRLNVVWAFRLWQEPRRLWRRYLLGIPLFLWHVAGAWFRDHTAAR